MEPSAPISSRSRFSSVKGCLACVLCAALVLLVAGAFVPRQSIWIDETSQLNGIKMSPTTVVRWLCGRVGFPGVAPDRTPPLAYWAGQAWSQFFGTGVNRVRWMGVAAMAVAAALVCAAGRRAITPAAGLLAGLLFALSPNVIVYAVEIRAYPIFTLAGAMAFYAFVRHRTATDERGSARWLIALSLFCVIAMYVHFFGVVLAGALLGAVLLLRWWEGATLRPGIVAMLLVMVGAVGIYPFVTASIGMTPKESDSVALSSPVESGHPRAIVRLVYRLIGHPAMSPSRAATVAALTGAGILLVVVLLTIVSRSGKDPGTKRQATPVAAVALALLLGFVAVTVSGFVVKAFETATPHYNAWMLPGLFILLCGALGPGRSQLHHSPSPGTRGEGSGEGSARGTSAGSPMRPVVNPHPDPLPDSRQREGNHMRSRCALGRGVCAVRRFCSIVGVLLLAGGEIYGAGQLVFHGEYFAHGPYARIAHRIRQLNSARVTVIEDSPDLGMAPQVYFPLRYLFGESFPQYVVKAPVISGKPVRVHGIDQVRPGDPTIKLTDIPATDYLVVIGARAVTANELGERLRSGNPDQPVPAPGLAASALARDPHWERVESRSMLSLVEARVDIYRRKGN